MSARSISQRPYLLRAMHEWITDSGHTPHIVVNALIDGVDVPSQHVRDGKIILNVSYAAVQNLELGNRIVLFEARFGGVPHFVRVPVTAVLGIYARETSRGMVFSDSENTGPEAGAVGDGGKEDDVHDVHDDRGAPAHSDRSHLRVIK